jgi:hypothetical protein
MVMFDKSFKFHVKLNKSPTKPSIHYMRCMEKMAEVLKAPSQNDFREHWAGRLLQSGV